MQIYCRHFVKWSTTSLQKLVLYCVYIFYPFLILLPINVIHVIFSIAAGDSMCPVGTSPSSLFGVVVLGSIPFQPLKHHQESCVALPLMRLI